MRGEKRREESKEKNGRGKQRGEKYGFGDEREMEEENRENREMKRDTAIQNKKSQIKITKYFSPLNKNTEIECQVKNEINHRIGKTELKYYHN